MDINQKVGENIRFFREEQGYTQNEFAEECGISRAYYGRIERGEHSITLETCQKISKTLGIPVSYLFNEI
ncbi:MAG: helix-turn-helix transcriptional regulator [Clostridia bacterium]|nr:helix-turn-helix transcriptional regulator [Clostridia bacterium]